MVALLRRAASRWKNLPAGYEVGVQSNIKMHKEPLSQGIRAVAIVEATKAGLVYLAGFGLLALIHRDVQVMAERFVTRLHLNPARRYPHIFIDVATRLDDDRRLWMLASLAMVYAIMRSVEAYGLWRERRWAEWFALVTAAIYLPLEVYEIHARVTWVRITALVINAAIVIVMAYALRRSQRSGVGKPAC